MMHNRVDRIISGSVDKSVVMWAYKERSVMHKKTEHTETVTSLAVYVREEGFVLREYVLSGSEDKSVIVWYDITSFLVRS